MALIKQLILAVAALAVPAAVTVAQPTQMASDSAVKAGDISGTWIGTRKSNFGEMEIVYKFKLAQGKITGSQGLPFGESPIVDGQVTGDTFHFTVALESFGNIEKREVTGKIDGDTLVITPAVPAPPAGAGPGGPGGGGPVGPGGEGPGGPPPGGPGGAMRNGPIVFKRGTPTPSFRAASVDYATLPKVELPALHPVPSNGLAKTPPMGWNSWNKFRTKIDDKTVREIADAMVNSGMKDAGYVYVNIDDGWQNKRDADGVLAPNPNFPDMKALADYVHSKGLKLGIYSSPGPTTCGGYEGSYGHEEQDAKMYAAWGVDYLKYDWCSAARVWKDGDMHAAYQKMGEALKRTGRPIVYALCQYGRADVGTWGPEVGANLWRTSVDIRDRYDSMEKIGFAQSALAKSAGPGHWNDPDMLEVGNGGMSQDEYKMHLSLWAMTAAPLIAGNDVRSMNAAIREILLNREVIAIDQDPLGAGGTQVAASDGVVIWKKPLASDNMAVALFNRGESTTSAHTAWKDLGWTGKHTVRDLWAGADRGSFVDGYTTTVPPHGVVLIRVSR